MGVEGGVERILGRTPVLNSPTAQRITEAPEPHPGYYVARRCIDVLLGGFLLILSLPVLVLASVVILLSSRRSPLLVQRRLGLRGETFPMLKLRTMRDVAALPEPSATTVRSKRPDDPRITVVGALLRRTSIDELPQLVNVVAGQMSLVGPRPVLLDEAAAFRPSWQRRCTVQPGLTGLWQVSGRSSLSAERWMALDRLYVRRRSLLLDVTILLRTLGAVVTMRGAW